MQQHFRHILAPVDFSPASEHALRYACDLAPLVGARLTVLHVANPERLQESLSGLDAIERLSGALSLPPDPKSYLPSLFKPDDLEKSLLERMRSMIPAPQQYRGAMDFVIVHGYPSLEIVNYARGNGVDMIVMGTHGRGPIGHLLLGSVAENVVRHAHCPVLTIRAPAERAARA